ncbi:hypothetical protein ABTK05_20235, partial [Acinetobacter baumannii]
DSEESIGTVTNDRGYMTNRKGDTLEAELVAMGWTKTQFVEGKLLKRTFIRWDSGDGVYIQYRLQSESKTNEWFMDYAC